MLYTNLIHLETAADLGFMTAENDNVLVICGNMDPESVRVFRIAETLAKEFLPVKFCDMEFDNPESVILLHMPESLPIYNKPILVYYQSGRVVKAAAGIQSKEQITININELILKTEKV